MKKTPKPVDVYYQLINELISDFIANVIELMKIFTDIEGRNPFLTKSALQNHVNTEPTSINRDCFLKQFRQNQNIYSLNEYFHFD